MDGEKDDLAKGMDEWELAMARTIQGNGLSHDAAMGLASMMRWDIEIGLRKPGPLIVITGI